jgi:hypothetical protein
MASYSLIRGWLECSFEDVASIQSAVLTCWENSEEFGINRESADLYMNGWFFPKQPLNWTSVIFYGANVRSNALPFLKSCLTKIAESGIEVSGFFHVDNEDRSELLTWSLSEQSMAEEKRIV